MQAPDIALTETRSSKGCDGRLRLLYVVLASHAPDRIRENLRGGVIYSFQPTASQRVCPKYQEERGLLSRTSP
ncbi:hypothetical protein CPSG_07227 [Coccidioides posadasii str. Silveira]|uniref:Uncharacterized protein n=1 Tax=Coccidioides posadasii (strain RMSCC 757 / Silveira) TaxID=443226 RepID=E9DBM5_COCPS|nr:hypothetical protein CPSG_07227 [Coccidioides posadasii str. Silveira]